MNFPQSSPSRMLLGLFGFVLLAGTTPAQDDTERGLAALKMIVRPELYQALTEPPCSYCSTQNRKGLIDPNDRVIAWIRGAHNGGAIPLRHFLSGPRVINDTYGLFFYDPDGGYVAAYQKDYGYQFHGWKNGVMVVQGRDGSLWSALTGIAFAGPSKGKVLTRIPSFMTDWSYWLMLHPESTAYDLFDGQRYSVVPLPTEMHPSARASMGQVDARLPPQATVLGVQVGESRKAYALDELAERACINDEVGGEPVTVFWYKSTRTAVAFRRVVDGKPVSFVADPVPPESAPMEDAETNSRWTLAGRAVDGQRKGTELEWVNSIQCKWSAWSAEFPATELYQKPPSPDAGANSPGGGTTSPPAGTLAVPARSVAAPEKSQADGGPGNLAASSAAAIGAGRRVDMFAPAQISAARLAAARDAGAAAIALMLGEPQAAQAARQIQDAGWPLHYWIEVAHAPDLATSHPEWMASLQGHPEWRRFFPEFPLPRSRQVVKNFPWVPVTYRETFPVHVRRVELLLRDLPPAEVIYLNDLQGSPSACGCGNALCRWTADYGKLRTTSDYGVRAAADFVAQVARLAPGARVVPIWTTECEAAHGVADGLCAGVGCYAGRCWKDYTAQLMPTAEVASQVGVLTTYQTFHPQAQAQDSNAAAAWVAAAVRSFAEMPPQRGGQALALQRLVAVLQGWDAAPAQIAEQQQAATAAGAGAVLVAFSKIDQSWEPRIFDLGE